MLLSCLTNVVSRSSLNVIDRYLLKDDKINFNFIYFTSIFLPFIYAFLFLPVFGNIQDLINSFFSIRCFLLALATNLVGLSFSHAFRSKDVRHVMIHTKIPELILPFFLLTPLFSGDAVSLKHCIPLILMWISFIPYFLNGNHKKVLFDTPSLCILGTLLFQMLISSTFQKAPLSLNELLVFTMAVLLWRCILSLMLFSNKKSSTFKLSCLTTPIMLLIGIRGVVALLTQFTFNWAITEGHPLFIWPILNTTLIVSSLASQFFLKEQVHKSDWIALCGLFASSCLIQMI